MNSDLKWSTDPVAFYHQLHPRPVLLTVCAPPKTGGPPHQLGSITDPGVVGPTGILGDPQYSAIWWTLCGQRPSRRRVLVPHAERAGWHALTRRDSDTDPKRVGTLAACWVDLDLKEERHQVGPYREQGRTLYDVFVPAMLALVKSKGLPVPTLAMRSGRGLWLYWRLVDEHGDPVTDDGEQRWARVLDVQERLIACFPGLADPASKDRKRLMRIPGSVHPEGHVTDWALIGGGAYTIAGMDASVPRLSSTDVRTQSKAREAARRLAPAPLGNPAAIGKLPSFDDLDPDIYGKATSSRERFLQDLRSLRALACHRGGMPEGIRYHTLLVALTALRHLYPKKRDLWLPKLWHVNVAICRPPQPADDVAAMVASDARRAIARETSRGSGMAAILPPSSPGPLTYPRIWDLLRVTPEERDLGIFEYKTVPTPTAVRGRIRREDTRLVAILRGMLARGEWGQGVIPPIVVAAGALRQRGVVTEKGKAFTRERVAKGLQVALLFPEDGGP